MKSFFEEMFDYNFAVNQKLIAYLIANKDWPVQKSLRLMNHIVNVHHVWNSRIEMKKAKVSAWDMQEVEKLAAFDRSNKPDSINIVENTDLEAIIQYTSFTGDACQNSTRDILFHIINHSTHHRAQISADCGQVAIEPLSTDDILYKR